MKSLLALILLGAAAACSQATPPPAETTGVPPAEAPAGGEAAAFGAGDPPQTPVALAGGNSANGSGCNPGAGPLADGAWYGHAIAWDETGVDLDLACFYTGEAAAANASARNDESPPPNDYYVVNDVTTTRRVSVSPDTPAYRLAQNGVGLERTTYADLIARPSQPGMICPGEYCTIWVFINGGRATEVMWQHIP